jgi:predicted TIM-barrel fold metal-dependent hydrolase
VISAADYVVEPPDLWTSCLSSDRWGDAIPHVARQSDGVERWVIGGTVRNQVPLAQVGALLPQRFEEPRSWADVPEAAYSPKRRLEAMDRDGVEISVLYPGAPGYGGEAFAAIVEPELEIECCRAYNDWLLETWGGSPRFVPQCLLPISSVEASRAELERAVNRGHRGAVMHPFPWHARPDVPHIHDTAWDPLWDAAQGLGVPLCWEAGAGFMLDVYPGFEPAPRSAYTAARRPISGAIAVASFLLGGIPERFPTLKVVFTSSSVDWIVFQLENSDWEWQQSQLEKEQIPRPSEVFHRQCYVTTWFEKAGLKQRDFIGVDNILWQVGFPGSSSTYPETQAAVRENLGDLPDVERQKIIRDNAAKLYGLT